jgi:carbon monoxide dehydrogenase subunit G
MKIQGSYPFATTPETLWPLLQNPQVLCQVVPGCQTLTQVDENQYQGQLFIRLGPMAGMYEGALILSGIQAQAGYAFHFTAQSETGTLEGNGRLHLEDQDGLVYLHYAGQARAGGSLQDQATPLLETTARSIVRQSLERLGQFVQSSRLEGVGNVLNEGLSSPKAAAWRDVRQPTNQLSPRQTLYTGLGITAVFLFFLLLLRRGRAPDRA